MTLHESVFELETLELRCTRLEEELAFQDASVTALNTALAAQQQQLDIMEQRLRVMEQRFRDLWEASQEAIPNLPPPHYGPQR